MKDSEKQNPTVAESKKIKGSVVLMKKNVLDFNDIKASLLDRIHELFGKGVSMQLISSVHPDQGHHHSLSLSLSLYIYIYNIFFSKEKAHVRWCCDP